MPRTLITGGAGFVGSHLCDRFIQEGHEVVCMDNLITGRPQNVAHLEDNDAFTFVEHDICTSIPTDGDLDYVVHFASPASPKDFDKIPIEIMEVGSYGTQNALELARDKGARYIFASTSEVYGDPEVPIQSEDYFGNVNPIGPRSVYDEAKRFSEAMTMAYHRTYGVDTRIVRIFNTYGPRMAIDDGRALPNFMSQALRGEPITVYGTGKQTRSFCYVTDLVDGIYRLLMSDEVDPVNIGNPEEITIREFAEEIIDLTGTRSEIVEKEMPEDDPKRRKPDITRATEILGWKATVSRREGLKRTLKYFEDQMNIAAAASGP
jgi:dTDP-glucose 4,6-dehydratase